MNFNLTKEKFIIQNNHIRYEQLTIVNDKRDVLPTSDITAQAVVIGCSHNNQNCNHDIHPSSQYFYTIDVSEALKPDCIMDITKDNIPTFLQNKFQLTILEYLPFDTYNYSPLSEKIMGINGQRGLDNSRELTSENGFIMVVGNSRNYRFRNSVANLNYLEIASSNAGNYVLLIPNNQNRSAPEVMQDIQNLPDALQQSISTATTQGYKPEEPLEFCKLNYHIKSSNEDFIDHLNHYIMLRSFQEEYKTRFNILGIELNFGYSSHQKISAANALIHVLLGNAPEESLAPHKPSLTNGVLGQILNFHLKGKNLSQLINESQVTESSLNRNTTNDFKERFKNLNSDLELKNEINPDQTRRRL